MVKKFELNFELKFSKKFEKNFFFSVRTYVKPNLVLSRILFTTGGGYFTSDQKWTPKKNFNLRGGVFYVGSKMNSKKKFQLGGGIYVGSKWTPKKFQLGGSFTLDQKWTHLELGGGPQRKKLLRIVNHERILNFKPCLYLAYFRSYAHLKIVKCIGMY